MSSLQSTSTYPITLCLQVDIATTTQKRSQSSAVKSVRLIMKAMPHPQEQTTFEDKNAPGIGFSQVENPALKRKRSQNEATSPSAIIPCKKNSATGIEERIKPLEYWTKEFRWPNEYFEPESNMNNPLRRGKSSSSRPSQQWEPTYESPTCVTPSDQHQQPRELKSVTYLKASYEAALADEGGSFMFESNLGITDASKNLCRSLLEKEQATPKDSLFNDDIFDMVCQKIRGRNEQRVILDIARLIVPSAESLASYGATHLDVLVEGANEGWNKSFTVCGSRPQPDYSVGFARSAFTPEQLQKLKPFIGRIDDFQNYYMATFRMHFPFLTSEVKCGASALDVADRQNAHSMTIAVRGVVNLFRLVKREKELHREILAFSISHSDQCVRIYGHYPVIDERKTTFYRHKIHAFDFTVLDGKEKWTAYKFTKNVYDNWMPIHVKRIYSVVDQLPSDLNFEVSEHSSIGESGLSQRLESQDLFEQTSYDAVSMTEAGNQSSSIGSGHITPSTVMSTDVEGCIEGCSKMMVVHV
ncbi:hypothetical protein DSL72_000680 [Monilinia vaccinii-corymbosi]|uniref:DUF7924 domain-containing protein n=1 Tax=Monilinia vaccinii-corymbosi TaxID=61207 RepID=A0A8A3PAE0_9HELO|nr:hypothetical protein DSL72_000680 [Monilinia vaccinii-corymbosi]